MIAILLILRQHRVDNGFVLFPLVRWFFTASEITMESFGIDGKWTVSSEVWFDDSEDFSLNIRCFSPSSFVPIPEIVALNRIGGKRIELHISSESRLSKVGTAVNSKWP